jgi:hypothetical protein
MINFLGKRDFNNPQQLKNIAICIRDNLCETFENTFKKVNVLLENIHEKTFKFNFLNPEIDEITKDYCMNEKTKSENTKMR